jgi:hypothetical protein
MPAPKIIEQQSPYILVETDYKVMNMFDYRAYDVVYGDYPVVYKRYNTTDQSNWVVDGGSTYPKLFIISPGNFKENLERAKGQYTSTTQPDFLNKQMTAVAYIGTEAPNGGVGFTGTTATEFLSYEAQAKLTQTPKLQKRNYLDDFDPRMQTVVYSDDVKLYPNSTIEEVTEAWNRWKNSNKSSNAQLRIAVGGKMNKTSDTVIESLDQLIAIYPRYYTLTQQQNAQALWEISGHSKTFGKKWFADGQWWKIEPDYIGLWETYAKRGLSDSAIRRELLDAGYTQAQINQVRGVRSATVSDILESSDGTSPGTSGTSGTGGTGGTSPTGGNNGGAKSGGTTWLGPEGYTAGVIQNITIQRSKNIFFTSDEFVRGIQGAGYSVKNSLPVMYQVYRTTDATPEVNQYIFDIIPNEINYSGFGGEWTQIERVGTFPFIDWKQFKLLQISFSFVIASKEVGSVLTADGMELPITQQIAKLQKMAQAPYPIMFYGFDTLMTSQFRYDGDGNARGVQFVIQDLSISASRRNANMEITRATANITLQEIPIERQTLIGMPRLKHTATTPGENITITDPSYDLASVALVQQINRDFIVKDS